MNATLDLLFVGLDVAKGKADVCLLQPDGRRLEESFENSRPGHEKLLAWLDRHRADRPIHAGLESTGPYSRPWCELLYASGHAVSLLNPARPKAYGQACGQRNKTDRVDARLLAQFVAEQQPSRWVPPAQEMEELKELTRRREELLTLAQAEKNRVESALCKSVRDSLARSIKALEKELGRVEDELEQLIGRHPSLRAKEKLLCSIPGIGQVTARKILAELPDVSCFQNARQAAAYAGLSPRRHESGKTVHKKGRLSKIGNAGLRKALYMPAIVAIKHNPVVQEFAQRLRANGKCESVIIGAAMRKLLHIAFGVLKHKKPFDPAYWADASKNFLKI
jgi:transposase